MNEHYFKVSYRRYGLAIKEANLLKRIIEEMRNRSFSNEMDPDKMNSWIQEYNSFNKMSTKQLLGEIEDDEGQG